MSHIENMKRLIGGNMRRLRKESGNSVDELAAKAGCGRVTWYEVENGVTNPTLEMLINISRALGKSVRDLLIEQPVTSFAQSAVPRKSKPRRKAS